MCLSTCPPVYLPTNIHVIVCVLPRFQCVDMSTCPPVYLSTCLPADHVHVESCIYKTFNVPTCLPVYLSTCLPVYLPTMYMLTVVFTKLSMCRPVYLSTCLPVHHVHVKAKIFIYNSLLFMCLSVFMSTKDEFSFEISKKK